MLNKLTFINFLKKRTGQTLRNKPNQWSLRLPWVLFFVALAHIVIALVVLLTEWDVRKYTNEEVWVGFLSIVVMLGAVFYCIYLFRFNVFKRFGQLPRAYFVRTFLGFFLVFSLMATCFFTPSWVTTIMARAQYDDVTVAKDINRMNTLITTLEKDSLPHYWTRYKVEFLPEEDIIPDTLNRYDETANVKAYKFYRDHYKKSDADPLEYLSDQEKILTQAKAEQLGYFEYGGISYVDSADFSRAKLWDSVVIINEAELYIFKCPDYIKVNNVGQFFSQTDVDEITNKELFYNVINDSAVVDIKAAQSELAILLDRYTSQSKVNRYGHYIYNDIEDTYNNGYVEKYELSRLHSSIQNVSRKYYEWDFSTWFMFISIIYYAALVLSLFLFLFRHNRIKDYFLSILAGILLAITTGVTIAMSYNAEIEVFAVLIALYVIIALVLATKILKAKRSQLAHKIGMNLLIFATPFIPFLTGAFYYHLKHESFDRKYDGMKDRDLYRELSDQAFYLEDFMTVFNQAIGIVVLLVLIHFFYSKILKRSYSLPKV